MEEGYFQRTELLLGAEAMRALAEARVLLVGVGIILSIRFAFRYQRKIIFNFKNNVFR